MIADIVAELSDRSDEFKLLAIRHVAMPGYVQLSALEDYKAGRTDILTIRRMPAWPISSPIEIIP